MAQNVELWMRFDGTYQPALSIPVDACQRFAIHPLAWLRYVAFTIYGGEGHISLVPDGPEVDYYQVIIKPGIYHYVSQVSFLLDPDLMDGRTTDALSVSSTSSRGDFAHRVGARDGFTCVMTGVPCAPSAVACHIVPHAKGDQVHFDHRHEDLDLPLEDINDTRNGILLAVQLHGAFGASDIAFLQTPNFAMTVNDVDLVMQPANPGFVIQPSAAQSRLTLHHFNANDSIIAMVAPHNSDARQSGGADWPPPLIFDVAYGYAALKKWGVPTFVNFAREHTRDIYYDDEDNNGDENGAGSRGAGDGGGNGGNGGVGPSGDGQGEQILQRKKDRAARAKKRAERRGVDQQASSTADPDFADMILGLWAYNAKKRQQQGRAMETGRIEEKVRTWLDSTESST